jgi:hypothetical protein
MGRRSTAKIEFCTSEPLVGKSETLAPSACR